MIKRFLILIICVLLLATAFSYSPVSASSYSIIRVKISTKNQASLNIVIDGEYIIAEEPTIPIPRGSYTVSVSGNNVRLRGPNIDKVIGRSLTFIRCEYKGSGNNHLTLKGVEHGNINYLGNFAFTVSSGVLNVVNHVPLEQYLYGVVAYEMSDSFPLEALKVQAVSARSYAARAMSSSGSHDIGDTATHQVYKGYNPSFKNVIKAVDETAGEVLSYNNKIVSTFYSASNGGQTELAGNIWGGGSAKNKEYPYLVQKDDPYDLENPNSLYQKIFVPKNPESASGDIVKVVNVTTNVNIRSGPSTNHTILGKAPNDSVFKYLGESGQWYEIEYNGGKAYVSKSYSQKTTAQGKYEYANNVLTDIQKRVHDKLKSDRNIKNATDIKIITIDSLVNGIERWPGTGSRNYVTANVKATVAYLEEGSSTLSGAVQVDVALELMKKSGSSYSMTHDYLNSDLRMRGVEQAEGGYYITNARYGHGVGMSQRGAQTMAGQYGKSYKEILDFYFPGTKILKIDSSVPGLPNPANNPMVTSRKYNVRSSGITGLSTNMSVETFLSNLEVTNGSARVISAGKTKTSGNVGSGDILQLINSAGATYLEIPIIIYGDVNGDGDVTLVDLLNIHRHLLRISSLNGVYFTAADVNGDSNLTLHDMLKVHRHLRRIEDIKQ